MDCIVMAFFRFSISLNDKKLIKNPLKRKKVSTESVPLQTVIRPTSPNA